MLINIVVWSGLYVILGQEDVVGSNPFSEVGNQATQIINIINVNYGLENNVHRWIKGVNYFLKTSDYLSSSSVYRR